MTTDLLGNELTPDEQLLLETYEALKRLCERDLPPVAQAGVRAALAELAQPVNSLGLAYEHLNDIGV
jgi:hypothetical protein